MLTLEQTLADARDEASVLRRNGHAAQAETLDRFVSAVILSAEDYLTWLSEGDARMRSGWSINRLRGQFAATMTNPPPAEPSEADMMRGALMAILNHTALIECGDVRVNWPWVQSMARQGLGEVPTQSIPPVPPAGSTYTCQLCGTTTPMPHACPAFASPAAEPRPRTVYEDRLWLALDILVGAVDRGERELIVKAIKVARAALAQPTQGAGHE